MNTPDYVQKRYDRTLSDGLPGSMADANPTNDASFIAENSDIGFGLAISLGSSFGPPARARIGTTAVQSAAAGYALGTGIVETLISAWAAITDGEFSLLINGTAYDVTGLDFSAVTDMDDVAAVIQAKIRAYTAGGTAFTSALVEFTDDYQIKISSGTTGAASSVTYLDNVDGGYGTNVLATLGLDSAQYVAGVAAVSSATLLGVTIRSLVEEGGAASSSDTTTIKEGHVGAFRRSGAIKVLCTEDATALGTVYIVNATGAIVSASGAGRTALGTSKFQGTYAAGTVGVINLAGLI